MTVDGKGIATRAMLMRFSVTAWSGRKFERKASDQVAKAVNATPAAGRYNKHLMANAKELAAVISAAGKARDVHYTNTLPWSDEGSRLLATANWMTYTDAMRAARAEWQTAVDEFIDAYPRLQQEAVAKLGDLYREDEYPPARDIKKRFTWDIEPMPLPANADLRLDLPEDVRQQIEADVTARLGSATELAMQDAWRRLHDSVARIKARTGEKTAAGKDSPLRATLITQAREQAEVLGRLNVTGDAALDAMRDRVLRELAVYDVELLRDDPTMRAEVAARADQILTAMQGFYAAPEKAA